MTAIALIISGSLAASLATYLALCLIDSILTIHLVQKMYNQRNLSRRWYKSRSVLLTLLLTLLGFIASLILTYLFAAELVK